MRKLLILALALSMTACSAYKPKKTVFYKDGRPVKTFVGRGVYDGNEWFGRYRIWSLQNWHYYEYRCYGCTYEETEIVGMK